MDPVRKIIREINKFDYEMLCAVTNDEVKSYPLVQTSKISFGAGEKFSINNLDAERKLITLGVSNRSINWMIGKVLECFGDIIDTDEKNDLVMCLILSVGENKINSESQADLSKSICQAILLEAKNYAYKLALNGNISKQNYQDN